MTTAVYLCVGGLLVWALVRRPQLIVITLAIAFGLAVAAADVVRGGELRSVLMGIDAFVVITMWFLWGRYRSERAALVASFGLVKITFGIASAVSDVAGIVWASGNNALFVVQVLIAGGFADGVMAWVGRSYHRFHSRQRGLLGYLEKVL
jgi:hypothetical protein